MLSNHPAACPHLACSSAADPLMALAVWRSGEQVGEQQGCVWAVSQQIRSRRCRLWHFVSRSRSAPGPPPAAPPPGPLPGPVLPPPLQPPPPEGHKAATQSWVCGKYSNSRWFEVVFYKLLPPESELWSVLNHEDRCVKSKCQRWNSKATLQQHRLKIDAVAVEELGFSKNLTAGIFGKAQYRKQIIANNFQSACRLFWTLRKSTKKSFFFCNCHWSKDFTRSQK